MCICEFVWLVCSLHIILYPVSIHVTSHVRMSSISSSPPPPPHTAVSIPVSVPSAKYLPVLKEQLLLSISAFANVEETDFSFVDKETFRFKTPDVDITIGEDSSKVPLGETVQVRASFSNPLAFPLTGVSWFVEGAGLTPPIKIDGRCVLTLHFYDHCCYC